ncbi:RsmE family RNA methyltransferase [Alicyclobacillus herbarius]|uniref:RsmE family RNA methyltransferase n=1 Tax=Alicyclobacillus herbarius TaxID=122960 RepID=UPI000410CBFE|nr:RsmE family RNA methyltransferase [Alicyclobacillus herbarius]
MPRVFVDQEPQIGQRLTVDGEDGHHFARVLRARVGEPVAVAGSGRACLGRIVEIDRDAGAMVVLPEEELPGHEPALKLYLIQGLAKGDKIESIVQKGTELGMAGFVLLQTNRSVARVEPRRAEAKLARWRRVAREAAAQAQRDVIPKVELVYSISEAATWLQSLGVERVFLLDEEEDSYGLRTAVQTGLMAGGPLRAAVAVGPEGGWSDVERKAWAEIARAASVTLGPRILRTETAGIAAAAAILYEFHELGG